MSSTNSDSPLTRTLASTGTIKLAELHKLELLHTPIEERFERITRLARRALRVPVAAVTLMTERGQWFKSVAGWDVTELPLEQSLCTPVLQSAAAVFVPDTLEDERYSTNRFVQGRPQFRFYAGHPLLDRNDTVIGTFCVMHIEPRKYSLDDVQTVRDLAGIARNEILTDQLANAQAMLASKLGSSRREALLDPLTRLWNRRGATILLRNALSLADSEKTDVALCVIDIDRFKSINDLHGHQVGDKALRKVGRVLTSAVREDDTICRYGGDEFVLIICGKDSRHVGAILERIREDLAGTTIQTREGSVRLTVSAGYAMRKPGERTTEEALFEAADDALRQSKTAGRNRIRIAS